jgi:isopentenyl diphosphate isomerase/L-lactate dehydrogenase-like FMN-dependent dehydrogenase
LALPVYRAYRAGGAEAAAALIDARIEELKAAMVLTGAADLPALAEQPIVLGERLRAWTAAGCAP